ncbi:MAG: fatty acid desaturase, partial [Cyanobacteria bacterium J06555_13]
GLGSLGLIVKIIWQGFKQRAHSPQLPQQIIIDLLGMVGVQVIILSILYSQAISFGRYLIFLIILERGIGIIMQTRDHLEHFGCWQPMENYQLTQLYSCRNIKTFPCVNWLMGGLPYHSVHHAFPQIPSYHLPLAFQRLQVVLQQHQQPPMILDLGYVVSSFRLGCQTALIETNPTQMRLPTAESKQPDQIRDKTQQQANRRFLSMFPFPAR